MNLILPDLFRCFVTDVMIVVFIYIMSKPRYKNRWIYITVTTVVISINIAVNSYGYLNKNYDIVVIMDLIMLIAIAVVLKPLFFDSILQWCFSFLTILNIDVTVIFVSYILCDFFPYPYWSNSILRLILFSFLATLFWRFIRPLYYKIVEYWYIYSLLTITLLINFLYYFLSKDVEQVLVENFIPILLLIILELFVYIGIFTSFKIISNEYSLREEKIRAEAQRTLLESELSSYDEFLQAAKQSRHDLRHHNSLVLEYLASGDVKGAEEYLKSQIEDYSQSTLEMYCEHAAANAVFRLYARKARDIGISYGVQVDIPKKLPFSNVEIGSLLSNILENAIYSCKNRKSNDAYIRLWAVCDSYTLKIKMQNSVFDETIFDENAMPLSKKEHGGTGTLSICSTVKNHGGMVSFSQERDEFITRIVLPFI